MMAVPTPGVPLMNWLVHPSNNGILNSMPVIKEVIYGPYHSRPTA